VAREGVLNLDKPAGLTSHDVVNRIRRLSGVRRVGHAGTLDPLATGVLLLCIGRATRLIEYLVDQGKVYETTVRLGQSTDTYDAEGEIVAERPVAADQAAIAAALDAFRGPIAQIPPMYSAIKRDGQPLYKLARQGITVAREPRAVTIYELQLLDWTAPDLKLRVACSSGTYIRSLAHDLGETLGCGGHLTTLRRTAVGPFTTADAVSVEGLTTAGLDAALQPAEVTVAHLPALRVTAEAATDLEHGRQVARGTADPAAPLVRIIDPDGLFLGVARPEGDAWQPHKILHRT
jgi:tRNA pseudouridine55 synthase